MKKFSLNAGINFVGVLLCILLTALIFINNEEKILIGVLIRGAISLLVIYNGMFFIFSNKPSFLVGKAQEKHRKIGGVLLLIVGIFALVTAVMGYGINGYPLLDWKTVFGK